MKTFLNALELKLAIWAVDWLWWQDKISRVSSAQSYRLRQVPCPGKYPDPDSRSRILIAGPSACSEIGMGKSTT
jgi:hypothetical protein